MLEIKIYLDVMRTSALGYVDGILVGNLNGCDLGASDGISLGSYQVDIGSIIWKGWVMGNIRWALAW